VSWSDPPSTGGHALAPRETEMSPSFQSFISAMSVYLFFMGCLFIAGYFSFWYWGLFVSLIPLFLMQSMIKRHVKCENVNAKLLRYACIYKMHICVNVCIHV
jgi:hypothetical protein